MRASIRIEQLARQIDARLAAAGEPVGVKVSGGRKFVLKPAAGSDSWTGAAYWREVPFLSSALVAMGYGRRHEIDGVPF